MSRLRSIGLVCGLSLLAISCAGDLGPGTPACLEDPADSIDAITILQLQAVPDATWGPCIAELKVGWEYDEHLTESGRATFWLDSDRMGDRFLEATLASTCDTTGAMPAFSPAADIQRLVQVEEAPRPVQIAVIPVAPRHSSYAGEVLAQLDGQTLEGRDVVAFVPVSNAAPAVQIERALNNGQVAVIVDDREEASRTVEMRRTGETPEVGVTIEDALDELEDDLGQPRYRATWFHLFDGGCITYRIDAEGSGAETVASDIDDVMGFFPLADLRRNAAAQGFDV